MNAGQDPTSQWRTRRLWQPKLDKAMLRAAHANRALLAGPPMVDRRALYSLVDARLSRTLLEAANGIAHAELADAGDALALHVQLDRIAWPIYTSTLEREENARPAAGLLDRLAQRLKPQRRTGDLIELAGGVVELVDLLAEHWTAEVRRVSRAGPDALHPGSNLVGHDPVRHALVVMCNRVRGAAKAEPAIDWWTERSLRRENLRPIDARKFTVELREGSAADVRGMVARARKGFEDIERSRTADLPDALHSGVTSVDLNAHWAVDLVHAVHDIAETAVLASLRPGPVADAATSIGEARRERWGSLRLWHRPTAQLMAYLTESAGPGQRGKDLAERRQDERVVTEGVRLATAVANDMYVRAIGIAFPDGPSAAEADRLIGPARDDERGIRAQDPGGPAQDAGRLYEQRAELFEQFVDHVREAGWKAADSKAAPMGYTGLAGVEGTAALPGMGPAPDPRAPRHSTPGNGTHISGQHPSTAMGLTLHPNTPPTG